MFYWYFLAGCWILEFIGVGFCTIWSQEKWNRHNYSGMILLSDENDYNWCNWIAKVLLFMQGVLLGLLLFPMVFKFVLRIWECSSSSANSESRTYEIGKSLIFFVSLGFILIVIVPSWMQFAQDFSVHPLLWYYFYQHITEYDACFSSMRCVINISSNWFGGNGVI